MWIISNIDHELPIILNSETEVLELLQKWNTALLEDNGTISEVIDNYNINDKQISIKKQILTWDSYDESNPYACAYLYNYSNFLLEESVKEKSKITVKHCTNPLFGENQKVSGQYFALRVKYNENEVNKLSIQILRYPVSKNIEVSSPTSIYAWLLNTIEKVQVSINSPHSAPLGIYINSQSNNIAMRTRRGPGNIIVAGDEFISKLVLDSPVVETTVYESDSTQFVGILNRSISVYSDKSKSLPSNVGIITYRGMGAIDGGAFIIEDNNNLYLNALQNATNSIGNVCDFYKIIELV